MAELFTIRTPAFTPEWLVARTRSRHEKQVARYLQARNIEYLLPLYAPPRRAKPSPELPLFPGYIFVNISRQHRLEVLQAPGVADFVGFGSGPHSLQGDEVELLRRCAELGHRSRPCAYESGRKVLIAEGPFRGIYGVVLRAQSSARIVVSIPFIQRSVEVEVSPMDITGS